MNIHKKVLHDMVEGYRVVDTVLKFDMGAEIAAITEIVISATLKTLLKPINYFT